MQLVSPIFIHWIVIYPVHNVIHLLNNRGLMDKNYAWHDNRRHTWNTVTIAQRKSSKLLLEVTSSPSASLNSNFPPNKFIPRIANANMNRKSRPKKVITLVMVLITTSNWYRTVWQVWKCGEVWCYERLIGRNSLWKEVSRRHWNLKRDGGVIKLWQGASLGPWI